MNITLEQMLAARDRRVEIQNDMLARGGQAGGDFCLACLTLNIAGDVKRSPMIRMLFDRGLAEFDKLGLPVRENLEIDEDTGCEAFWLIEGNAEEVKGLLERVEEDENIIAARLFDFDVMKSGGANGGSGGAYENAAVDGSFAPIKLSRSGGRKCLLCESPAAECSRSRRHGLDAVKAETARLLSEFCAKTLAAAACDSLIAELETTPKPGLVDLNNNGAHKDMDVDLLRRSTEALRPYFRDAALLGMKGCSMKELRPRGIEAEKEMFAATGGVNTHKGIIYSMGLLLAGMGKLISASESASHAFYSALNNAAELAAEDAEKELRKSKEAPVSHGGEVYKTYGIKGATGEAVSGFPNAVYCAERLEHYKKITDANTSGVFALADSMARLDDTNLLHRGGAEGLEFARASAAETADLPESERLQAIEELDKEMIKRNLSPGGSADMLALAYMLEKWKELSRRL